MTTVREITIASIGEPASIKIERNSKGYNYEISLKAEDLYVCWSDIMNIKNKIEAELYENQSGCNKDNVQKC